MRLQSEKMRFCGLTEGGSVEGRLTNRKYHVVRLLDRPPDVPEFDPDNTQVHPSLPISDESFFLDELKQAKAFISEGKACGEDDISPKVLKQVDINDELKELYNNALLQESIPDHWKQLLIVPVKW